MAAYVGSVRWHWLKVLSPSAVGTAGMQVTATKAFGVWMGNTSPSYPMAFALTQLEDSLSTNELVPQTGI